MKTRLGNNPQPFALYLELRKFEKVRENANIKKEFCGVHIKRAYIRKNLRKPKIAPIYARTRARQKCREMQNIKKERWKSMVNIS